MEYELCCEIFKSCSRNQMRDITFQTVETSDPETYVRGIEAQAKIIREDLKDGTVIIHTDTAGLLKRYTFSPI